MVRSCREHDTAGFTASDRLFHELIVDAADNAVLSVDLPHPARAADAVHLGDDARPRRPDAGRRSTSTSRSSRRLRGDDQDAFCAAVNDHLQWSIALARESR